MRPSRVRWTTTVALFGLVGCIGSSSSDLQAEVAAIRELDRRWLAAEVAKDAATASSFFALEAIEMPPNTPPVVGRDAIRKWFEGWLNAPGTSVTFSPVTIEVARSGDIAYERGVYAFVSDGPRGRTEDPGKYLTIWKKIDGQWKVIIDTANSNNPCPAP